MSLCTYKMPTGKTCSHEAVNDELCYWHDEHRKEETNVKQRLEECARRGESMKYFKLAHTDLSGVNLVNRDTKKGYELTHADLYHCNLQDAHLYGLDLSFSSLMKADLRGANLHNVNMEFTDLLGVKLEHAKLEGVQWGDMIKQEWQAKNAEDKKQQHQFYSEAEEIYRSIGRVMRQQGLTDNLGWFQYREMVSRRKQMPCNSLQRFSSKFIDLYCGYGEKPFRLLLVSWALILCFAIFYAFSGLLYNGNLIGFDSAASLSENISILFSTIYFSVVTFTTLGYGDLTPIGASRFIAATEAFAGTFTMALFVFVFVRRMTR